MSKKRKTRKQKENSAVRLEHQHTHVHIDSPVYSISGITPLDIKKATPLTVKSKDSTVAQKDAAYLKHDMIAITAASGIVAAFDILLFVLLTTGNLQLHFLGY